MKLNWSKWFYDLSNQLMRHCGTAGLTWGGLTIKHGRELNGAVWSDLAVSILIGAIFPTFFSFLQNNGLPKDEDAPEAPAPAPAPPTQPAPTNPPTTS